MSELFEKSIRVLELPRLLEMLEHHAVSVEAKARARRLTPSDDFGEVNRLLDETDAARKMIMLRGSPAFGGVRDVGEALSRAERGGMLNTRELLNIAGLLTNVRRVQDYYKEDEEGTVIDKLFLSLHPNRFLEEKITTAILDENEIADAASPELAEIRRHKRAAAAKGRQILQRIISSPSYRNVLQDALITQRGGRFVVPVKAECRGELPGLVHDTSSSGATIFVEPMGVVQANNELKELEAKEEKEIDRILRQLFTIGERFPDCAIDVTGGSDAALFAAGMFAAKEGVPAFTYSRKKNRFYDISGAAFADELPCGLTYSIEDFFLMAGGTLLPGRVDNQILSLYLSDFDPFFDCFLQFRRDWPNIISYIQRISPAEYGQTPPLSVVGGYTVKGERGSRNTANEAALRELARIDFIQDLEIIPGQQVSFRFRDLNTRAWLRDVGSALELYAYKACVDSAIFHDVISSAVVRWDEVLGHGSVSNEIDVMAARGVIPLFLSCKACDIKTEALNELAILRDRFGGKGAKAAIVTTEVCNAAARHRAAQLGIAVIDLEELKTGLLVHRLKVIMKAE